MRRDSRVAVAAREEAPGNTDLYDVLLLAGSPKQLTLHLVPDLAAEAVIEVDGEEWMVADVRSVEGARPRLICIYAH